MDVRYKASEWERIQDGLNKAIIHRGMSSNIFRNLQTISEKLEEASELIRDLDRDRIISFHHKNRAQECEQLGQDFNILRKFVHNVDRLVDEVIDDPFYNDIDAYVVTMRDINIKKYSTKNHIKAKELVTMPTGHQYQVPKQVEQEKSEVTMEDLLKGDNHYAWQFKQGFQDWKKEHPDKKLTEDEFRDATLNGGSFEYKSIEDEQQDKETIWQIAAAIGTTVLFIACPIAGLIVAGAIAALEIGSAVTGRDYITGRKLGAGERATRAAFAAFDFLPGVKAARKLAGIGRAFGTRGIKTAVKA
ncbi:hypothetical protein A374_18861, partial [Fictibacillus macauensis ZFHKF-1]